MYTGRWVREKRVDWNEITWEDIICWMGGEVWNDISEGYRGDYLVLIRREGRWGYLCIGYGSCSVCDMLAACFGAGEIAELMNRLEEEIVWRETKEGMVEFLENRDWKGTHLRPIYAVKDFVKRAVTYMEGAHEVAE